MTSSLDRLREIRDAFQQWEKVRADDTFGYEIARDDLALLLGEVSRLDAELAALTPDAKRWRFVRRHLTLGRTGFAGDTVSETAQFRPLHVRLATSIAEWESRTESNTDRAEQIIDAAISAATPTPSRD